MKYPLYLFALTFILSGCAKVTQEIPPCSNPPYLRPISDTIVSVGYDVSFLTSPSANNVTVNWTGPDQLTYEGNELEVYVGDSSKYGMYTVTASNFACAGRPDTFYILPNHPGVPGCNVAAADVNKFVISDGHTIRMPYAGRYSSNGYFCPDKYEISVNSTNSEAVFINTLSQPVAGGYYDLDSTCDLTFGEAKMSITDGTQAAYYTSVSGRMYCSVVAGQKYITFCGAVFRKRNTGARVTLTGNLAID